MTECAVPPSLSSRPPSSRPPRRAPATGRPRAPDPMGAPAPTARRRATMTYALPSPPGRDALDDDHDGQGAARGRAAHRHRATASAVSPRRTSSSRSRSCVRADAGGDGDARDDAVHRGRHASRASRSAAWATCTIAHALGRLVDPERHDPRSARAHDLRREPRRSTPAENQPFWITVYVPPDAAGGRLHRDPDRHRRRRHAGHPGQAPRLRLRAAREDRLRRQLERELRGARRRREPRRRCRSSRTSSSSTASCPSGVAWPAGLNYNGGINYDCATRHVHRRGERSVRLLASLGPKYIDGTGWNGVGLPLVRGHAVRRQLDAAPADVLRRRPRPGPLRHGGLQRRVVEAARGHRRLPRRARLAGQGLLLRAERAAEPGRLRRRGVPRQSHQDRRAAPAHRRQRGAASPRSPRTRRPAATATTSGGPICPSSSPDYAEDAAGRRRQRVVVLPLRRSAAALQPDHHRSLRASSRASPFWAAWKYRIRASPTTRSPAGAPIPYTDPQPQGTNQNGDGFLLYPPGGRASS